MDGINAFATHNAAALLLLVGLAAVVALVLAARAHVKLQAVTRPFTWLSGQWDGEMDSLPALLQTVEKNARELAEIRRALDGVVEEQRFHFRRLGLVRYDAFDGVAGQQSYSLCLLDDNRNGFVLSNLVGANFTRSYAVEISDGQAPRKLGEEEDRALRIALDRGDQRRDSVRS